MHTKKLDIVSSYWQRGKIVIFLVDYADFQNE